jgi:TolA-binding protein
MRPLFRSLFLLSLSAAPLAVAGSPATAVTPSAEAVSTATVASVEPASQDVGRVRTEVRDLEATLNAIRSEVAQLREQADAQARALSEPVDQFHWGNSP